MKKGFTLVEILVTISILSVMGLLILNIFSRSLRGGNKAQIVLAIKQNGQSVLETMDKTIRGASQIVCINSQSVPKILVLEKSDGTYLRYKFEDPSDTANGQIWQDSPERIAGLEDNISVFINRICNTNDPMSSNKVVLTDANTETGVSIEEGVFTRDRQPGFRDVITINFNIAEGVAVPSGSATDIEPVNFKTTIQLR